MIEASSLKYVIFWVGSILGIPFCVAVCLLWRPALYLIFGALILSTFDETYSITFLSMEGYKAATRGFEVHITDLFTVILFISMLLRRREFRFNWFPPMMFVYLVFFFLAWISWGTTNWQSFGVQSSEEAFENIHRFRPFWYPLFEISKLLRGMFLFLVTVNFAKEKLSIRTFLGCASFLILVITFLALFSRYVQGMHRAEVGTFHVNNLNTYIGLLGSMILPFVFACQKNRWSFFYFLLAGGAFLTIVLTVSRSSLAGFILGSMICVGLSLVRYPNIRNIAILLLSFFVSLLIVAKAADTLFERFFEMQSTDQDMGYRERLNEAAVLMARDHFFGVGLGNYLTYSTMWYADRVMADPTNIAHNVYYLTLAEMGIPGLIAFIIFWIRFYSINLVGLYRSWSLEHSYAFPVFLGAFCATIVMQFQNFFHFSFRVTPVFFLMHIIMGFVVSMYLEMKNRRGDIIDSASTLLP